jgi:hypothetical protein
MLWNENAERIINISRANIAGPLVNVTDETYPSWLKGLFSLMHTRFLRLGYKHPPLPPDMQRVLKLVDTAMQKVEGSRPLNVVIVGGSIAQGYHSCQDPFTHVLSQNWVGCKWPFQLQKLCDDFLGKGVVRVVNLAVGGTDTEFATPIIKYKLYNPDAYRFLLDQGPDIIINAYSTNDAAAKQNPANLTYDAEYHARQREVSQRFIRVCRDTGSCVEPPMVVYLDDYIGNRHDLILAENSNGRLTNEMSEWYGVMFISYATAVRRLVYANQQAGILSPLWRIPTKSGSRTIEVHFGLASHMALTWVVAYSFLSAAVDFCDDGYDDRRLSKLFPEHYPQDVLDLAERVIPPPLDGSTSLQTVSDKWLNRSMADLAKKALLCDDTETQREKCAVAFTTGLAGIFQDETSIQRFLRNFTQNSHGWEVESGTTNTFGYVATERNATTTFYRDPTPSAVRMVKLHYLRSYGAKWDDSRVNVTLRGYDEKRNRTILEKSFTLEGYHYSKTTAYGYGLDLSANETLPANIRIELTIRLISGTNFQLNGLLICE